MRARCLLLLGTWLALVAAPRGPACADAERDLQPVPPLVVFDVPEGIDRLSADDIDHEIRTSFADPNRVVSARTRLVYRFGVVASHALGRALSDSGRSKATWWNAAATLGALRMTYGPAHALHRDAIRPLMLRVAGHEEWTRAFAALALGTYPWNELAEEEGPANPSIPHPGRVRADARRRLRSLDDALGRLARDPSAPASSAALLALAKRGGSRARNLLEGVQPPDIGSVQTRRAAILARGLLGVGDPALLWRALDNEAQSVESAAAALAVSLSLLMEEAPDWTANGDLIDSKLLVAEMQGQPQERAEVLFARAVNAWRHQRGATFWRKLWLRVLTPTTERPVAIAGAQALMATGQGAWLDEVCYPVARKAASEAPAAALALAVYRTALVGTPEAVRAASDWLRQGSRRPTPSEADDPRPYAVIGLLRAMAAGRVRDAESRRFAVKSLRRAAQAVLPDRPFRADLADILERHGESLRSGVGGLQVAAVLELAAEASDPFGFFVHDLRDAAIDRLNAHLHEVFQLSVIRSAKEDDRTKFQGERYLHHFLVDFPYFARIDLLTDRGKRLLPAIDDSEPMGLNR